MPIYELRCQDCGAEVSLLCSWAEKEKAKCPKCGSSKLSQKFTSIGVIGSRSDGACPAGVPGRSKFT